jgi:hypothetical protein
VRPAARTTRTGRPVAAAVLRWGWTSPRRRPRERCDAPWSETRSARAWARTSVFPPGATPSLQASGARRRPQAATARRSEGTATAWRSEATATARHSEGAATARHSEMSTTAQRAEGAATCGPGQRAPEDPAGRFRAALPMRCRPAPPARSPPCGGGGCRPPTETASQKSLPAASSSRWARVPGPVALSTRAGARPPPAALRQPVAWPGPRGCGRSGRPRRALGAGVTACAHHSAALRAP